MSNVQKDFGKFNNTEEQTKNGAYYQMSNVKKGLGKSNNTEEQTKNGAYYQMFYAPEDNSDTINDVAYQIASLVTDVQSAAIKAGSYLEKILENKNYWGGETLHINKAFFFNKKKVCSFETIIKYIKSPKNYQEIFHNPRVAIEGKKTKGGKQKENEPDLIILTNNQVFVVEIKLGCNFDTSKSKGEREKLLDVCKTLKEKLPEGIEVTPIFVCWRCKNIKNSSIKDVQLRKFVIIGEDFANKFNINKKLVDNELTQENNARLNDYLKRMCPIVGTHKESKEKIHLKKENKLLKEEKELQEKIFKKEIELLKEEKELQEKIFKEENKLLKEENKLLKEENKLLKEEIELKS